MSDSDSVDYDLLPQYVDRRSDEAKANDARRLSRDDTLLTILGLFALLSIPVVPILFFGIGVVEIFNMELAKKMGVVLVSWLVLLGLGGVLYLLRARRG